MIADVRAVFLLKASSPMLVTLLGIVMEVMRQSMKAQRPMLVNPFSKLTEARPVQFLKADSPIVITLPGRLRDVRDFTSSNALLPILSNVFGNIIETRLEQP